MNFNMTSFLQKILFQLSPERSHHFAMRAIELGYQTGLTKCFIKPVSNPLKLMGLTFPNRIGLAAGLDKNADYVDALSALGFGFIEVGTITPRPQQGNPQPRLFRLTEQKAVINRMGFNNKGIGKNKDTPLDNAIDDYLTGFHALWQYASYITINISSPNTPGLRDLQHGDMLASLLAALKQEQARIAAQEKKYVPLVVKISPDLSDQELQELAAVLLKHQVDGVIATNTTLQRDGTEQSPYTNESGGLSGKPLEKLSTRITQELCAALQDKIPVIASGGVMDRQSANDKLNAGAKLLQVYTGFIYGGVNIISELGKL
jgi:dihydroorotate dehydrogenase